MKQFIAVMLLLVMSSCAYADTKISALTEATSNQPTDITVAVTNPNTSAITQKMQFKNVTVGKATALATYPTQCNGGSFPSGVDTGGNAQNCVTLTSGTSLLYGNGSGGFSNVTIGSNMSFSGGVLSSSGTGGGGGSGTINSGTVGNEAVYSGSTTVNSGIITDTGTNVGINQATPVYKLDVNGSVRAATSINTPQISNLTTNGFIKTGAGNGTLSVDTNSYLTATGSGSSLTNIPTSVSNSDSSLTISPTTGNVVASVNMGNANTWTGTQTFNSNAPVIGTATASTPTFFNGSKALVSGSVSGSTTKVVTTTGSLTTGHLGSFDASGNLIDSGISSTGSSQWTTSGSNIYVNTYNVGIGTSLAPVSGLDVAKNVSIGTAYAGNIAAPTNGMVVQGNVGIGTASAITSALVVNGQVATLGTGNSVLNQTSGNVGIGSPTPGQKLDVTGTIRMTGLQLGTSATSGYVLTTDSTGTGTWQVSSGGSGTPGGSNKQIQFNNSSAFGGTAGFVWDGTNVGIGSAIPNYNLNIKGSGANIGVLNTGSTATSNADFINDGGYSAGIGMGGTASSGYPNEGYAGTYSSKDFILMTNATTRMYLKAAGNISIGTSTAPQLLTVGTLGQATIDSSGNILTTGNVGINTAVAGNNLVVNGGIQSTGTGTSNFTSNVGVGSANPRQALDVIGTIQATSFTAGTTAGTNCSGSPDSSFHVINGIVTAC